MADANKLGSNTGNRGKGRPAGSSNKVTSLLKDAILQAAEAVGEDKEGKGGLTGYCMFLAKEEPRAFASLLGRALPTEVSGNVGHQITADPLSELFSRIADNGRRLTDGSKEVHQSQ